MLSLLRQLIAVLGLSASCSMVNTGGCCAPLAPHHRPPHRLAPRARNAGVGQGAGRPRTASEMFGESDDLDPRHKHALTVVVVLALAEQCSRIVGSRMGSRATASNNPRMLPRQARGSWAISSSVRTPPAASTMIAVVASLRAHRRDKGVALRGFPGLPGWNCVAGGAASEGVGSLARHGLGKEKDLWPRPTATVARKEPTLIRAAPSHWERLACQLSRRE